MTLPQLASLKAVEIGFALSKNFWGMGLMPEALAAVIGHLFDSLGY
ncbi:MAG: GNAT family N-acetyltransferase, partial [Clostridia bacterium]|nr:GNAT family N-acetyltransferase [Clostridia bacterium]